MKRFYYMRPLLLAATAALALTPSAYAQVIGTGNSFDAGRDQIGIVRDGTFEGYATPASLLTWVQTNITFPPDRYPTSASLVGTTLQIGMSLGPTLAVDLSSLDESAAVTAVQNSLNAHVAADLDLDPANERGVLGNGTNGNLTYQPYPGAPVATVVQPSETVTGTAAANTLARGLSLGSVNKPVGSAATMADVTGADAGLDVSYGSMQALFTNRAAEGGSAGMMNADGSLGAYSITYGTPLDAVTKGNFATISIVVANGTTVIPDGQYSGQLLVLQAGGVGEQVLSGLFRGTARQSDHAISYMSSMTAVIIRPMEAMVLRWNGSAWVVIDFNYWLYKQTTFSELADGTAIIHYHDSLTSPDGVFEATPLPVQITNPTSLVASVTDRALGAGSTSDAVSIYAYDRDNSTASTFLVMRRFVGIAGTNRPASDSVGIIITNAKLDYAALGWLASF